MRYIWEKEPFKKQSGIYARWTERVNLNRLIFISNSFFEQLQSLHRVLSRFHGSFVGPFWFQKLLAKSVITRLQSKNSCNAWVYCVWKTPINKRTRLAILPTLYSQITRDVSLANSENICTYSEISEFLVHLNVLQTLASFLRVQP